MVYHRFPKNVFFAVLIQRFILFPQQHCQIFPMFFPIFDRFLSPFWPTLGNQGGERIPCRLTLFTPRLELATQMRDEMSAVTSKRKLEEVVASYKNTVAWEKKKATGLAVLGGWCWNVIKLLGETGSFRFPAGDGYDSLRAMEDQPFVEKKWWILKGFIAKKSQIIKQIFKTDAFELPTCRFS